MTQTPALATVTVTRNVRTGSTLSALTGLAGALLYLIGALLPGAAPKPDATTSEVAHFFTDQRSALLTGLTLELLAVGFLIWFLGALYAYLMSSSPPQTALGMSMVAAFVATIAIVAVGTIPSMAIIWSGTPGLGPDLTQFAYDIQTLATYVASSTTSAISILAPSVIVWRTRVLPRWLCALGAAAIVVNVVELAGLSSRHGTLAGGYAAGLGPLLWIAWFAGASVCLAWRTRPSQRPQSPVPPAGLDQ